MDASRSSRSMAVVSSLDSSRRFPVPKLTTDDLCKILHYALQRETRLHGQTDLDLEIGATWDDAPREYKMVLRGAVSSLELVVRKAEREDYRQELIECLDDLRRNPVANTS